MKNKILITAILSLLFLLSGVFYYQKESQPVSKTNKKTQIFVIRQGENLTNIAKNLERQKLIRNRIIFYLLVKKMGLDKSIQAGDFRLSPSMRTEEIIKTLTHGTLDVWVTIIEGLRNEEIAQILNNKLKIPTSKFLQSVKNEEGFLFPDTYLIPKTASVEMIASIMKNNFRKKYAQALQNIKKGNDLTLHDTITLSSLVEKEGKTVKDKYIIANILYKRLIDGWPLQVDATVQYILGYQSEDKTWWKKNLTKQDLEINSLYNTYKYKGLPKGPICNPGLDSIKAVLSAKGDTPYWFYISDKKGKIHFSKTTEEHSNSVKKYLSY